MIPIPESKPAYQIWIPPVAFQGSAETGWTLADITDDLDRALALAKECRGVIHQVTDISPRKGRHAHQEPDA